LQWESEEEELEETHLGHQEEGDHQEEAQLLQEGQQHNQLQQQPMSRPWAKTLLYSKERERKQTPS